MKSDSFSSFVNIIINIRMTIFDDLASQSLIEVVWVLLFSGGECRSEAEEDRDARNPGQKGGSCFKIVVYKDLLNIYNCYNSV